MPTAPSRPCTGSPTCPHFRGACPDHGVRHQAQQRDRIRGTAHARGYTRQDWQPFRRRFMAMLVDAGILPVCGAALPSGPARRDSACLEAGVFTYTSEDGSSLHLDHEPELHDHERTIVAAVCDPDRIVLKCRSCHARKTARATPGGSQSLW